MKTGLEKVSEDPTKRRLDSMELVSSVGTLLLLGVVGFFCRPEVLAAVVAAVCDAYVISRTLMKLNRDTMRYSSIQTSELKALGLAQGVVFLAFLCGGPGESAAAVLAVNQAIFNICRGVVKRAQARMTLKQQVIGL